VDDDAAFPAAGLGVGLVFDDLHGFYGAVDRLVARVVGGYDNMKLVGSFRLVGSMPIMTTDTVSLLSAAASSGTS